MHPYGYRQAESICSADEMQMYEKKFYQGEAGSTSYSEKYSEQELRSFARNAAKKELIIHSFLPAGRKSILDLGCGEGFLLKFFHEKGWEIAGIDLSEYGILNHNPDLRDFLWKGDCETILEEMIKKQMRYDVVNADLFLEGYPKDVHVLLNRIKNVICGEHNGIAVFRVGNYASPLHNELLRRGVLTEESWFHRVGNYAYFGKETFEKLLSGCGYECLEWYGDTFVDFNLMNPIANYYDVEGIGKACYKAMLDIEDIMEDVSLEKMVELEKVMGDMGFGRHITCVCRVRE